MGLNKNVMKKLADKKLLFFLCVGLVALTRAPRNHVDFSGEWKLNEYKIQNDNQFPVCIFGEDRMQAKTIKVASFPEFITVDITGLNAQGATVVKQEKLMFDGTGADVTPVGWYRDKSAGRWSDDGQTLTVSCVRSFARMDSNTPDAKVTEEWKLINDGNSIFIRVSSKIGSRENTMTLIYDRYQTKNAAANIIFKSADGGVTWED